MNTKGHCYPKSIIQQTVYFKLRFTLSYQDLENIMKMPGVHVDHATIQRWVYKFTPIIESEMKKKKDKVGTSWRLDETYIKVKGIWCYLYRAVNLEASECYCRCKISQYPQQRHNRFAIL